MNPALQQLNDIHLPQAISMWPVAPGYIILYFILSGLMCYAIYFIYRRKKQRRSIQFALQQLKQLQALTQYNPNNINIAAEISTLMRRTALHYFKRDTIAGLSGQQWLQFLNHSSNTTQFTDQTGQLLIDAPYRKHNAADLTALFALVQMWLSVIAKKNSKEN